MMAKGNFCGADFFCVTVENPPPQTRAHGTGCFTLRGERFDHAVRVLFNDIETYAQISQVGGQHMFGKAWLLLV